MKAPEKQSSSQTSKLDVCYRRVTVLKKQTSALSSACEEMAVKVEGYRVLSAAMVETSRSLTIEDLCHVAGRAVHSLEPHSYVAVDLYQPSENRFRVICHFGFNRKILAVLQSLGMNPCEMRFSGRLDSKHSTQYTSGHLERVEGGLFELLSGQVPHETCDEVTSALGITEVHRIGFAIDGVPHGGITIMLGSRDRIRHTDPIESLASHVGLVMRERHAIDTLRVSEERFRSLFEQSMDPIFINAPDGSQIEANPAWLSLFGYTRDEVSSINVAELYADPEQRNEFLRLMAETGHVGEEGVYRKKDGTTIVCVRNIVARKDLEGNVVAFQGISRDVTAQRKAERALKDSEQRYRLLANNTLDVIWQMDLKAVFTYVNPAIQHILGFTPEEWIGSRFGDHATSQFTKKTMELIRYELEHLESHVGLVLETVMLHKDGTAIPLEIHARIVTDEDARPIMVQGVARDISQRKKDEEKQRQSQRETALRNRIAEIFLTSPHDEVYARVLQVILEATDSPSGVFCYVNDNGALVCPSFSRDNMEEYLMSENTLVFPRDTWTGLWGRALKRRKSLCANSGLRLPDGRLNLTRALDVPLIHHSRVIGNLLVGNKATDYTEADKEYLESIAAAIAPILDARLLAERAQAAIRTSGEQMSHLAQRLEEVREEERTNLARELHDTAGQAITALKLDVGHIKKRLEEGMSPSQEELDTLGRVLDWTADDVRRISSQLRPGVLDDIGLEGAVEWEIDELRKRSTIDFSVSLPNEECWVDDSRRTTLFRVFQELLTNIIRHANARTVAITLEHTDGACVLTMADDGCGIDLARLEDSRSLGIIGMRERLRLYGGELSYSSAPGKGTIARAVLPAAKQ